MFPLTEEEKQITPSGLQKRPQMAIIDYVTEAYQHDKRRKARRARTKPSTLDRAHKPHPPAPTARKRPIPQSKPHPPHIRETNAKASKVSTRI